MASRRCPAEARIPQPHDGLATWWDRAPAHGLGWTTRPAGAGFTVAGLHVPDGPTGWGSMLAPWAGLARRYGSGELRLRARPPLLAPMFRWLAARPLEAEPAPARFPPDPRACRPNRELHLARAYCSLPLIPQQRQPPGAGGELERRVDPA